MVYSTAPLIDLKREPNGKLYCFGAGKAFDAFVREFAQFCLEDNIAAVVDNDAERMAGEAKRINNTWIPIVSVEQMLSEIREGDSILITTAAYEEVAGQLEGIERLKNIKCYVYWMVRLEQLDYERRNVILPPELSLYKREQIPKIIHYCWFGKKPIPEQYRKWMDSWKYYCPDYEIREWNESNYDVHKCKFVSQAYEMNKWAFVSDYARLDIVNEYGGVYLDTDVELLKNIDELLKNDGFCGYEKKQSVNYGLGFGSKRENQILEEIKECYESKSFLSEDGRMDLTPCPMVQTEIMRRHGLLCDGQYQVIKGMTVYPEQVLCGMSPYSYRVESSPEYTYAVHHYEGSWVEEKDKKKKQELISKLTGWKVTFKH